MGVIPHGNDNQPSGTFSDEAIRVLIQIVALQTSPFFSVGESNGETTSWHQARWTVKFTKAKAREDGSMPAVDLASQPHCD